MKCNTECLVVSGFALSHLWLYGCGLTACCIPFQLCKFACAIFIVFIALALQLRVPCRTFLEVHRVFILQQKFVEAAKWHYAKTVIKLAWRPLCKSFLWELQMIISGVIFATCYIPFKFVGWKLLFACQLGQRSQQAYGFLY